MRAVTYRMVAILSLLSLTASVALAGGRSEERAAQVAADRPIELTFMILEHQAPGVSFNDEPLPLVWQAYEERTGVRILFDALPSNELRETVELRLAARSNVPDILTVPGEQTGSYLSRYYNDGVLIDVGPYFDEHGKYFKEIDERFPGYRQTLTLPDGALVGLGNLMSTDYWFRTNLIRQDWLDELGLAMPTNVDELLQVAIAFTGTDLNNDGRNNTIGFGGHSDQYMNFAPMFGLNFITGAGWSLRDGVVTYEPMIDDYRAFLMWMKTVVDSGAVSPDWITVDRQTHSARLSNGQFGITMSSWALEAMMWQDPEHSMYRATPGAVWVSLPIFEGQHRIHEPLATVWRTTAVSFTNRHPVETVKWMDWVFYSQEANDMRTFGIEGLTFEYDSSGRPARIPSDLHDNVPRADGTWLGTGEYVPGVVTNDTVRLIWSHLNLPDDNPGLASVYENIPFGRYPFVPPIPTVQTGRRISNLMADINTYVQEMRIRFLTGEANFHSDWDAYVANLKSLGIETVISLYQEAVDNR